MNREAWEDRSCSCHINPPCSKCMDTCGDCGEFREEDENGECLTCKDKNK